MRAKIIPNRRDYGDSIWRGCQTDVRSAILDELRIRRPLRRGNSKAYVYISNT